MTRNICKDRPHPKQIISKAASCGRIMFAADIFEKLPAENISHNNHHGYFETPFSVIKEAAETNVYKG
jgi:hypothetical protein